MWILACNKMAMIGKKKEIEREGCKRECGAERMEPGRAESGRMGPGKAGPGRAGPGRVEPGRAGPGRVGPGRVGQGEWGQGTQGQGDDERVGYNSGRLFQRMYPSWS